MTRFIKHGHCRNSYSGKASPEWRAWHSMKVRCSNPRNGMYHRYGGRGIKVCERWMSFQNFLYDMGARPSPTHSLDRIDNDGNYEPGNCRWATKREQAFNRGLRLEVGGRKLRIRELATELGINKDTIRYRLRKGWTVEQIVSIPASTGNRVSGKQKLSELS